MIKKLAALGLVRHTPYRGVELTGEGRRSGHAAGLTAASKGAQAEDGKDCFHRKIGGKTSGERWRYSLDIHAIWHIGNRRFVERVCPKLDDMIARRNVAARVGQCFPGRPRAQSITSGIIYAARPPL